MSDLGGVQAQAEDTEQRIFRVAQGSSLPDGWRLVQWLGTETGILHGPLMTADVVLAARVSGTLREALREAEERRDAMNRLLGQGSGEQNLARQMWHDGMSEVIDLLRAALAGSSVPGGEGDA